MTFSGCNSPSFISVKMDVSTLSVIRKESVSYDLPCSINRSVQVDVKLGTDK